MCNCNDTVSNCSSLDKKSREDHRHAGSQLHDNQYFPDNIPQRDFECQKLIKYNKKQITCDSMS